jgi:coenzyme F420-reducing hydrogenase gamma subunit
LFSAVPGGARQHRRSGPAAADLDLAFVQRVGEQGLDAAKPVGSRIAVDVLVLGGPQQAAAAGQRAEQGG